MPDNVYRIHIPAPPFEALDPTYAPQGNYSFDLNDPRELADRLGLSERDTLRLVEWAEKLREHQCTFSE